MNESPDFNKIFEEAMQDFDVPKIYSNGFISGLSQNDVTILLQLNSKPAAVMNLSYTTAKTLSVTLAKLIKDLEEKTGNIIMVTQDVKKAMGM
ncbi:hypothetical protein H8E88_04460 [candidate division KSB1 bacterium]|nr:hypothetical protein [candidate division KSB1 bacterium]